MANKRMFSKLITNNDVFLEMPASTRCLYYQLNLEADDDGFVGNPKSITKLVGASEDDLKLLILKKFIIAFESGIVVVKHWRIHNCLTRNSYKETSYLEEKRLLLLQANSSYSLNNGIPIYEIEKDGKPLKNKEIQEYFDKIENYFCLEEESALDKNRLEEIRLDKNRERVGAPSAPSSPNLTPIELITLWNELPEPITKVTHENFNHTTTMYTDRLCRNKDRQTIIDCLEKVKTSDFLKGSKGWKITFNWFVRSDNFHKIMRGDYNNAPAKQNSFSHAEQQQYDFDELEKNLLSN